MESRISDILEDKGFDPDNLLDHLRETLMLERELFDTKKMYMSGKELYEQEKRLINLENLVVTLMIERVDRMKG